MRCSPRWRDLAREDIGLVADMCMQAAEAATLANLAPQAATYLRHAIDIGGRLGYRVIADRARERLAELGYVAETL